MDFSDKIKEENAVNSFKNQELQKQNNEILKKNKMNEDTIKTLQEEVFYFNFIIIIFLG